MSRVDGGAECGLDNGQGVGGPAFEGASPELQVGGFGVGVDADQAALAGQAGQQGSDACLAVVGLQSDQLLLVQVLGPVGQPDQQLALAGRCLSDGDAEVSPARDQGAALPGGGVGLRPLADTAAGVAAPRYPKPRAGQLT